MKKLLTIIFILPLLFACSKDDDNESRTSDGNQNYTSFIFYQSVDNFLPNCVAAYKKEDKYYKIANLGDLSKGEYSPEIRVEDQAISDIYFFTGEKTGHRFDAIFKLSVSKKNIFTLTEDMKGFTYYNQNDPTQYPQ